MDIYTATPELYSRYGFGEEALLLAKYLRSETKTWIPRVYASGINT
jgi:hypothetical protein